MRSPLRPSPARRAALAVLVAVVASLPGMALAAAAAEGAARLPALSVRPPVPLPTRLQASAKPTAASSLAPRIPARPAGLQLPATGGEPIFVVLTGLVLLLGGVALRAASTPAPRRRTSPLEA